MYVENEWLHFGLYNLHTFSHTFCRLSRNRNMQIQLKAWKIWQGQEYKVKRPVQIKFTETDRRTGVTFSRIHNVCKKPLSLVSRWPGDCYLESSWVIWAWYQPRGDTLIQVIVCFLPELINTRKLSRLQLQALLSVSERHETNGPRRASLAPGSAL